MAFCQKKYKMSHSLTQDSSYNIKFNIATYFLEGNITVNLDTLTLQIKNQTGLKTFSLPLHSSFKPSILYLYIYIFSEHIPGLFHLFSPLFFLHFEQILVGLRRGREYGVLWLSLQCSREG